MRREKKVIKNNSKAESLMAVERERERERESII